MIPNVSHPASFHAKCVDVGHTKPAIIKDILRMTPSRVSLITQYKYIAVTRPSRDLPPHPCTCPTACINPNGSMKDAHGAFLPEDLDPSTVCGCQVPTVDLCHDVYCGKNSACR